MSKTEKSLLEHHSNNCDRQFWPKSDAKISDQMFEEKLDFYIFSKYHLQDCWGTLQKLSSSSE